jgi:plastocyanin
MHRNSRILIALAVLLSGFVLVPYATLRSEAFNWQRFADAYQPLPVEAKIRDFAYEPDPIVISVGTTVGWKNDDDVAHTVTSTQAGLFDSGTMQPADTFEFLFDTPGTYPYYCTLHPSMTGTVIVVQQLYRVYLPAVAR